MADNASETTPLVDVEKGDTGTASRDGATCSNSSRFTFVFKRYLQPSLAEMFGVTLFVFIGTASVTSGNILGVAVAHGVALATIVAGLGSISGGHINPAVTLGVLMAGGIRPALAACYFLAQIVGGIVGAACCRGILNYKVDSILMYEITRGGAHQLGEDVTIGCGVFCEIMLTILLVTTVLMTAVDSGGRNVSAPLLIGFSVAAAILAGGAVSGASMNPARSFGPAVLMSDLDSSVWTNHWVYWVGPLSGAIITGVLYRTIFASSDRRLACKED